jgi:hypothetical protein
LEINEHGTYKNQFADEAAKLAQDDEILTARGSLTVVILCRLFWVVRVSGF